MIHLPLFFCVCGGCVFLSQLNAAANKWMKRLLINMCMCKGRASETLLITAYKFRLADLVETQRSLINILGVSLCVSLSLPSHTHWEACLRTGCNTMMSPLLWLAVRLLRGGGERLEKGEGGIEDRVKCKKMPALVWMEGNLDSDEISVCSRNHTIMCV